MKKNIILVVFLLSAVFVAKAQDQNTTFTKKRKVGWFIAPEYSTMFLEDHVGQAVGFTVGVKLFNDRLKVGYYNYARSGVINSKTFSARIPNGGTYKGRESLDLRADHGAFGLMLAPTFRLPNSRLEIDVPIYIGSIGAGFYLSGDDRDTPDGRRVSEWEDELFNDEDAAFAGMMEFGVRLLVPTKLNKLKWGVGLHYLTVQDWSTFVDPSGDFYNNKLRASVFVQFGSPSKK